MSWPVGVALFDEIKRIQGHRKLLLGFSRGKDAVGAAVELVRHFDVIPVYYDTIPGLEFVAESIDYYERKLFGRKIYVVPHGQLFRMLEMHVFQDVWGFYTTTQVPFPKWTNDDVRRWVCEQEGLDPKCTFLATGVRSADSVTRRTALVKHGPITRSRMTVHAVWDWNKERLVGEIGKSGVKLPIDYKIWGRSLDGVDARFMLPLWQALPDDYRRACCWFPYIPLDIVRYRRLRGEPMTDAEVRTLVKASEPLLPRVRYGTKLLGVAAAPAPAKKGGKR